MTTPTFLVRPVARLEAFEETTYSSSSAAACTRWRVASDTWPLPLSARETVAVETPASWATSLIPGMTILLDCPILSAADWSPSRLRTLYPCSARSVR